MNITAYYNEDDRKEVELQRQRLERALKKMENLIPNDHPAEIMEIWRVLPMKKGEILVNAFEMAVDEIASREET